jgi:hypothetical protein
MAGNDNVNNNSHECEMPTESTPVKSNLNVNSLMSRNEIGYGQKSAPEISCVDLPIRSKSTNDIVFESKSSQAGATKLSENVNSLNLETSKFTNNNEKRLFVSKCNNESTKNYTVNKIDQNKKQDYIVINLNEGIQLNISNLNYYNKI